MSPFKLVESPKAQARRFQIVNPCIYSSNSHGCCKCYFSNAKRYWIARNKRLYGLPRHWRSQLYRNWDLCALAVKSGSPWRSSAQKITWRFGCCLYRWRCGQMVQLIFLQHPSLSL